MENVQEKKTLESVQELLTRNDFKKGLTQSKVLRKFREGKLEKNQVGLILGQWYYPLSNFPYFLSSLISHSTELSIQTFISNILWQELGCGDPENAHLNLYYSTMMDAGFSYETIAKSPPLETTKALVEGYQKAAKQPFSGLGFLYGTEVADLQMVSSIGKAVSNCTGITKLPWVDIHVLQEPDHVASVNSSLEISVTKVEEANIVKNAEEMWQLWIDFFENIDLNMQ